MRVNTISTLSQVPSNNFQKPKTKIVINANKIKSLKLKKCAYTISQKQINNQLPIITDSKSPNKPKKSFNNDIRSRTPLGIRRNMNVNDFSMNINNNYINTINLGASVFSKNDLQIILSLKKELKAQNDENAKLKKELEFYHKVKNNTIVKELQLENKLLNDEIIKIKSKCSEIENNSSKTNNTQNIVDEKDNISVHSNTISNNICNSKENEDKKNNNESQPNIDYLNLQNKKLKEVIKILNTNIKNLQNDIHEKEKEITMLQSKINNNNKSTPAQTKFEDLIQNKESEVQYHPLIRKESEHCRSSKSEIEHVSQCLRQIEEEELIEQKILKHPKKEISAPVIEYHHSFSSLSTNSSSLDLLSTTPPIPNMISPDEMDKVIFLIIKTIQSKQMLPIRVIQPILDKIKSIFDFTHEISLLFHLDSESQFIINRFAYGMGYQNGKFSIGYFKTMLLTFFSNNNININLEDTINILTEFKSNCISDLISKCIRYDTQFKGYIHFDIFTNIVLPYVSNETITKKGYEYLIYMMKKINGHNEDHNDISYNLFLLNYRSLTLMIPLFSRKKAETKEDIEEKENSIINFVSMEKESDTEEPVLYSTVNDVVGCDPKIESAKYTDEIFNYILNQKKVSLCSCSEEAEIFINEIFSNVISEKKILYKKKEAEKKLNNINNVINESDELVDAKDNSGNEYIVEGEEPNKPLKTESEFAV